VVADRGARDAGEFLIVEPLQVSARSLQSLHLVQHAGQQIVGQVRNFATLRKRPQKQEQVVKTGERSGIVEFDLPHRRQQPLDDLGTTGSVLQLGGLQLRPRGYFTGRHVSPWLAAEAFIAPGTSIEGNVNSSIAEGFSADDGTRAHVFVDLTAPATTNRLVTKTTVNAIAGRKANTSPRALTIARASTAVTNPRGSIQNNNSVSRRVTSRTAQRLVCMARKRARSSAARIPAMGSRYFRLTNSATNPRRTKKNERTRKLSSAWKASRRAPCRITWGVRGRLARVTPKINPASRPLPPK